MDAGDVRFNAIEKLEGHCEQGEDEAADPPPRLARYQLRGESTSSNNIRTRCDPAILGVMMLQLFGAMRGTER